MANRAGGGRCRAQARLQTGLENNGLTDRKLPFARPPVLSAARVAVEEALIHEIHANPNFKLKFSRCSLRDMSELIAYFKDYGRDYLVLYRTEICFEDDPRRVREAYATNRRMAERFVSIIGRDQFRSCVNRFLIRIHAGQPVRGHSNGWTAGDYSHTLAACPIGPLPILTLFVWKNLSRCRNPRRMPHRVPRRHPRCLSPPGC